MNHFAVYLSSKLLCSFCSSINDVGCRLNVSIFPFSVLYSAVLCYIMGIYKSISILTLYLLFPNHCMDFIPCTKLYQVLPSKPYGKKGWCWDKSSWWQQRQKWASSCSPCCNIKICGYKSMAIMCSMKALYIYIFICLKKAHFLMVSYIYVSVIDVLFVQDLLNPQNIYFFFILISYGLHYAILNPTFSKTVLFWMLTALDNHC